MDVLRFVNSKDIKDHLKSINYEFNSLETAWLIYQCKTADIEKKHEAWQQLINTMPDCVLPKRIKMPPCESLHQFLKEYIAAEKNILNDFTTPAENVVYSYGWFESGQWFSSEQSFFSYQECLENYLSQSKDGELPNMYRIIKHRLDTHRFLRVIFSVFHKPLDYDANWYPDSGEEVLLGVFDGLWFDFPTPFKKGDILCKYDAHGNEVGGFCGGPFVMTAITPEYATEHTRSFGDESDMNAWGYFQNGDGTIYDETMSNYMDLEYYKGDLDGKMRILKALSNYIKGEIDVSLFANAYHHILCDEHVKSQNFRWYTEEGLKLAGLLVSNQEEKHDRNYRN